MSGSIFEDFQRDVYARIVNHEALSNVAVFVIDPRDQGAAALLQSQIDLALATAGVAGRNSKAGAAILVPLPEVSSPTPEAPGPQLQLALAVRVMERPLINMGSGGGTLLSGNKIALELLQLLSPWSRGNTTLTAAPSGTIQKVTGFPKDDVAYDVHLEMPLSLTAPLKVSHVFIDEPAATVTMRATLGGTDIRYTLDGSYPGAAATAYSAPISTPASGTLIRAVGYSAGYHASDLAQRLIP